MLSSERKDTQSNDFIKNHIYLFLVDIVRLIVQNEVLPNYEKREPGYIKALLKAYIYAFKTKLENGKVNHDFFLGIYKEGSSHFKESKNVYKDTCNNYSIVYASYKKTKKPELLFQGLYEYVDRWFRLDKKPINCITFQMKSTRQVANAMYGYQNKIYFDTYQNGTRILKCEYNPASHNPTIEKLLTDSKLSCYFDAGDEVFVSEHKYPNVQAATREKMQEIFDIHNRDIVFANTPRDKRRVIARLVQSIDQIHPLEDCNDRTCYVLLNRLLHEVGQPLTLLFDPSRIALYPLENFVDMIEQGQEAFMALTQQKVHVFTDPVLDLDNLPKHPIVPCKLADAEAEVDGFIQEVVERNIFRVTAQSLLDSTLPQNGLLARLCLLKQLTTRAADDLPSSFSREMKSEIERYRMDK